MSKKKKIADFSQNLKQEQIEFEKNSKKASTKKQKVKNDLPPKNMETDNKSNSEYSAKKEKERQTSKSVRQTEKYSNLNTQPFCKHEPPVSYDEKSLKSHETYKTQPVEHKTLEFNKNISEEQKEYERHIKNHSEMNHSPFQQNNTEHSFFKENNPQENTSTDLHLQRNVVHQQEAVFKTDQNRIGGQRDDNLSKQSFHYSRNTQQEQAKFEKMNSEISVGSNPIKGQAQSEMPILHVKIENEENIKPISISAIAEQPQRGEINLKMIRTPSMMPHRIANLEKIALLSGATYLVTSTYRGTDTQKGIELSKDLYATSTKFVMDHVRLGISNSMIREMNSTLIQYHDILEKVCGEHGISKFGIIGHIHGEKDIQRIQRGINVILKSKYGQSISGSGKIGYLNAMRFLRMNRENLSPEIQNLIKQVYTRTLAQCIIRDKAGHFTSLKMLGRRKLRRYVQQTDSGYGLYLALDIVSRTKSILRTGIFVLRSAGKVAERTILLSAKAAAWGVAKTVKLIPEPIKNSKLGKKMGRTSKKIKGTYRKVKGTTAKGKLGVRKFNDRVRNFRRNPFGVRSGMQKAKRKATKALMNRLNRTFLAKPIRVLGKGFNIANSVVAGVGHLFSAVGSVFSGIINFLLIGLLIIILGGFVLSFISSAIGIVVSAFDFTTHKKEIREACLEQISKSYEEQKDEIARLQRTFRNVNIHYENIKDESAYKENKIEITETTNSAELLSMATVYFDFDLEKSGKRKVKKYIKQLYNGSHIISVVEKPYTYIDSDGKEQTVVDADITLTTYYFNQLFNCKLSNKSQGIIAGSEITEQVWNYLRTAGVPAIQTAGIMGNIYGESGFDANLVEHGNGIGFGLCQWSFERRTALENFAHSQGKSPGDIEVQLAFLMTELEPSHFNSYYTGENNYQKFMNAQDPETATYYFMWGWERPSKAAGNSSLVKRQRAARTYYDSYIDRELITEETEE